MKKITLFIFVIVFSFLLLNKNTLAQSDDGSSDDDSKSTNKSVSFVNPLTVGSFEELLTKAMDVLRNLVAVLAIFMIVVAGLIWITSAGSNRVDTAKNIATGAVIGLIIVLSAPSLLKEVYTVLYGEGVSTGNSTVDSSKDLYTLTLGFTNAILGFIGVLAILMIIVGGVMLMISGDSKNTERAKGTILWAVVGLVIAVTSLVVVNEIVDLFGAGS